MVNKKHIFKKQKGSGGSWTSFGVNLPKQTPKTSFSQLYTPEKRALPPQHQTTSFGFNIAKQVTPNALEYINEHQNQISKSADFLGKKSLEVADEHSAEILNFAKKHKGELAVIGGPGTSIALNAATMLND